MEPVGRERNRAAGGDIDPGERPLTTAQRELLEETGYEAGEWEELAGGPPSAGFSNEIMFFYGGKNLRKVGAGGGHGSERITVHEVPLEEVPGWLKKKEKEGVSIDPKVYAGLYFLGRCS